jgi:asparagine synthase (glutamine-hydrolysing)
MSALAGYWSVDDGSDAVARCRAMLAAQAAYGASDQVAQSGRFAAGCRASPPLPGEPDTAPVVGDGARLLVADLRLDNRSELGESLGLDRAASAAMMDAELLFAALRRWGAPAVERLLGDFAFAWFDPEARHLLLARDPTGQRSLFWRRGAGAFAFASMPKGILALPGVPRRADETNVVRYLASIPQRGPGSFYAGINRVEPGHILTVTATAESSRRYWTPGGAALGLKTFDDHVEAFRAEFDAAVARRLRGAGSLAATHLSGGWDSNAVTATAARLTAPAGGRLLAFTSVPGNGAQAAAPANRLADEGALASATARLYPNVEHILIETSGRSPIAELDRYAELFDRPVFNMCNHVWLGQIRAAAADAGAGVLLTGEVGNWTISASPNTLLADYLREGRWWAWLREAKAMHAAGRARLRGIAASSFGPWTPDLLWNRVRRLSSDPELAVSSLVHPRLRQAAMEEQEALGLGLAWRPGNYFRTARSAFEEMDFGEYRKGVLGGWGIDKRDPTGDRRLIDFCLSLPLDMLLKGGVRRPLARAALSDRLPAEVLDAPNKGYQAADWHEGLTAALPAIKPLIEEIGDDPMAAALIDVDALRRLVAHWPTGGWNDRRTIGAYRIGLLKALVAGHFVVRANRAAAPVPAGRPQ